MHSESNNHSEPLTSCDKENIALHLENKSPISRNLDKSPSYHEEYDEDGEVVKVGNLLFTDRILGSGAFAQVILAKRVIASETSSSVSSSKRSFPSVITRMGSLNSSIKVRISSFLENGSGSKTRSSRNSDQDDNSESIVQANKEEYVAVKMYSKSLLKRMKNIKRCSNTPEKRLIEVHTALENVEREIALMKQMRHPNLVSLLQVIDSVDSDALYVVLEFVPLGEIMTFDQDTLKFHHRHRHTPGLTKDGYFMEDFAALFFVDVLHGLAYLHRNCICHRDLKPENILMTENGVAKISDFGVSHFFEEERSKLSIRSSMNSFNCDDISISTMDYSEVNTRPTKLTRYDTDSALEMDNQSSSGILRTTEGTYPFWSPEMCSGNSSFSGYASDLWAAGVCLYIFTSGCLPFYSESPSELFHKISQGKIPFRGHDFSPQLKDLLSKVLHKDPSLRAGVGDCLKHEFCASARMERMKLLGDNIRQSTETTISVNQEDKHKAFSIARVAKAAQHKMSKRFQLARETFAAGTSRPSRISHTFSTLSSSSWMDFTESKKRFLKSMSNISGSGGGDAEGRGERFNKPKPSRSFSSPRVVVTKMNSSTPATSAIVEDDKDDDEDATSTLSNSSGRSKCIVM